MKQSGHPLEVRCNEIRPVVRQFRQIIFRKLKGILLVAAKKIICRRIGQQQKKILHILGFPVPFENHFLDIFSSKDYTFPRATNSFPFQAKVDAISSRFTDRQEASYFYGNTTVSNAHIK